MTNENNKQKKSNSHPEIVLTLVYTVVIVLFMWGLSIFLN